MNVNYTALIKNVKGTFVPKPLSGTLSGHSAGEPFDKHVYSEIKKQLPNYTFRQYEYLNDLYSKNKITIITKKKEREENKKKEPLKIIVANKKELLDERKKLIASKVIGYLLQRGEKETKNWIATKQFYEKQDDTADILVVKDDFYEIIDIKTRNLSKKAQPPNIISAFKIAEMCQLMIDNKEFDNLSINYFEVDWLLEDNKLVCKDAHFCKPI